MTKKEKIQKVIQYKKEVDKLIHQKHHELAQKYDLSLEQYHLLIELDELMLDVNDELTAPTVGQIAKNVKNSQNTVSEKITRLENKGFVYRVKDSSDKRISRVVLTEEGRKLIEAIGKQANNSFLFDSISYMEECYIDEFLKCFEELIKKMKKFKENSNM